MTPDAKPYRRLALMAALSFVMMYGLMYLMVATYADIYTNLDQLYMAGAMTAPMVLLELLLMRAMYPDRRRNGLIAAASAAVFILCVIGVRAQLGVGDRDFLRAMIPHHSAAIEMCRHADLKDADVRRLCRDIAGSQQEQIDWMRDKLGQGP